MKTVTISEIKRELKEKQHGELIDICLRLAKFKKENKELLNYLLFESFDEDSYIAEVKEEVEELLKDVNRSTFYFGKKTIRKILRFVNKQIKYSGSKRTEVELLIHFCLQLQKLSSYFFDNQILRNMYNRQLLNIGKALGTLDEDLQFDYKAQIDDLFDFRK